MKFFFYLLNFYIKSSIHVALSCYALLRITYIGLSIEYNNNLGNFVFFGTIVGYNFVKYYTLSRQKKFNMRAALKAIFILSIISLVFAGYSFFYLNLMTQITAILLLGFIISYTLPFFWIKKNSRNWAGFKIYIVTLCWVGVTVFFPFLNASLVFTTKIINLIVQRFLLVFVLILIFEIIDLKNDDPSIRTIPQQIGVTKTKFLGLLLLLLCGSLEFFYSNFTETNSWVNLIILFTIALFAIFSSSMHTMYYTSFWVEGIPIFGWLLMLAFSF
jgi:hypothetical protein